MKFLDNLKMGPKLIGSYVLLALITVALGFFAIDRLQAIERADTLLYTRITVPLSDIGDVSQAFQRTRVNLRDAIMTGDADRYGARAEELYTQIDALNPKIHDTMLTDAGKAAYQKYIDAYTKNHEANRRLLALLRSGKKAEAESILRNEGFETAKIVNEALDELQKMKVDYGKNTSNANTELAKSAASAVITGMILGFVIAVVAGIILARSITGPMQKGVQMMSEMMKGHLSLRLGMERKDEIGDLAQAMDAFAEDLQTTAVGTLKKIAVGDLSTDVKPKDAQDEISPALAQATDALRNMSGEAQRLAQAAVEGKLATRADASKYQGEYRKIVQGVNDTLDAVIGPLNVAAGYVDRISKGDIPPKITDRYNGDFNEIKNNLNQCVDAVNALVADANLLSKAAIEGKLATRADASKHQGDFRKIVQGVNETLDSVIGPLNVAAGYVDRISKGDIPPKITDKYNGDFNEIKNNLNQCVDAVNALVADANVLSKAAIEGKLATRADASKHQGDFRKIVQGVNETLDSVIGPLNVAAGYVDRISKGDIPAKITDRYNGDFNEIKNNLNQCIDSLSGLINEMNVMSNQHDLGDIDVKIEAGKFTGAYKAMAEGVNNMVFGHIAVKKKAMACVSEFGRGNFEAPLEKFPGKKVFINETIEQVRSNLKALIADAEMLSRAAVEGRLDTRADANKHMGDFRKIVQGVNDTLDAVINPVNEVMRVMAALEQGDLTTSIHQEYQGKLQQLRNAVNNTVKKLADTVAEIGQSANSLAGSAEELTATSTAMTAGAEQMMMQSNTASAATEQATMNVKNMAAGIEQISANSNTVATASEEISANLNTVGAAVEQMSSNMKVVANTSERMTSAVNSVATAIEEMSVSLNEVSKSSGQAANIASRAAANAGNAAQIVDKLGQSAQEIGKVVDMIKGIAAQTNLLALNATIEAASAGEAGKGFAVVANEVKELAKQTAAATEDIREQVEGMQGNTSQVVKAIDEIVQIINQINDISGNIAAAVEEQTATTNEISKNVGDAARGANDVARNVQQAAAGANEVSKNVHEAVKGVTDITRNIAQLASGANDVARNAGEAAKGMNDVAKNVITVSGQAQNTTRGASDTNNASKELARLAERLQAAVKKFRI